MPQHFLGLTHAAVLETSQFQLADQAIADLVELRGMGVIHGPAGSGKTFAVQSALEDMLATSQVAQCSFTIEPDPTMRKVLEAIVTALTGHAPPESRNRFQLTRQLIELLAGPDRLLVIDEAQRLNIKCIEVIRTLHDHISTRFSVLLVGGDGCWEVLSKAPMLRSRIIRRVPFQPLSRPIIPTLFSGYHPIYAEASPDLLWSINDQYAHGNLRDWAAFTHTAHRICTRAGREHLDEEITANAYALLGGGKHD